MRLSAQSWEETKTPAEPVSLQDLTVAESSEFELFGTKPHSILRSPMLAELHCGARAPKYGWKWLLVCAFGTGSTGLIRCCLALCVRTFRAQNSTLN